MELVFYHKRHWILCESCKTLAYLNSLTSFTILLIFQAKLEDLQTEKQGVVSQKEAADDGNRKLVSANCFVRLIVNTFTEVEGNIHHFHRG